MLGLSKGKWWPEIDGLQRNGLTNEEIYSKRHKGIPRLSCRPGGPTLISSL